ncbi:helix-turn-helix domain-containing protein [Kribbella sp. NBC_01245]|uniref:helix-turn-helix domain-containing protein n=1 Tax=Kribbella sp. NBC_01245 TaxID=2903578 RepID=UPI002E2C9940|nr:helix-turn-helix transcriptional regulator [Kribbella sp. NBC_01245]
MTPSTKRARGARLLLGHHLRYLRERAGVSEQEVADAVERSKMTWWRIENGQTSIRGYDVERACQAMGVTNPELIGKLTDLARQSKDSERGSKGWKESYDSVASDNFLLFTSLEDAAASTCSYDRNYLPGLLQTPGYMRGLMATERHTGLSPDPEDLEKRAALRLKRQEILTREDNSLRMLSVIHEAALRPPYAGAEAMREQLNHLLAASERDNISIRVMPADRDHAGEAVGQFILLEFPTYGDLQFPAHIYVDGYISFYLTDKAHEVERFTSSWPNIWSTALGEEETRDFITQMLADL